MEAAYTNFDFARNIREIERLKAGMLTATAELYELMSSTEGSDAMLEALASVISCAHALSARLGVNDTELKKRVEQRMRGFAP